MADPRERTDEEIDEDLEADEGSEPGRLDDEGGDDAEAGQELEEAASEERVDRRQRRDDQLREELRAEREHRARVDAELQQIRAERQQQQRPREETEQEFLQRISVLDREEQWEARFQRSERTNNMRIAQTAFAAADLADRNAFQTRAITDPNRKRLAQKVEETLAADRRANGRDLPRETVYKYLLGEERDARISSGKPSPARQQAERRVQSQQARTTGGRGDEPREQRQKRYAPGDMSPEAVRARLSAPDAFI